MIFGKISIIRLFSSIRDIAQLGRAPALGAGGRRFKSYYPEYFFFCNKKFNQNLFNNFD